MIAWQIHIDCCFSFFHVICFRIVVCNKFIFVDVDCENVKNRTHTFWNRSNRLIKNFIEANSLIVVTNSLNVIDANRLLKLTKRNDKSKFKFFDLMFWMLICWFDVRFDVCVISIFLFIKRCLNVSKRWIL